MVRPISISTQFVQLVLWKFGNCQDWPRCKLVIFIHFNRSITQIISKPNVHLKHMGIIHTWKDSGLLKLLNSKHESGFIYSKGLIVLRVPCLLNIKTGCIPGICIYTVRYTCIFTHTWYIYYVYMYTHDYIWLPGYPESENSGRWDWPHFDLHVYFKCVIAQSFWGESIPRASTDSWRYFHPLV